MNHRVEKKRAEYYKSFQRDNAKKSRNGKTTRTPDGHAICEKRSYRSKSAAKLRLKKTRNSGLRKDFQDGYVLQAYVCPRCHFWHIGHGFQWGT